MKLYENVVIGNFLYGLGFSISSKLKNEYFPSMISLLQQNPMDEALGDVMLEFNGLVRLIEFKSCSTGGTKDTKEIEKLARIKESIQYKVINSALTKMDKKFIQISKSIHWFVEADFKENNLVSRIVPYLDAYPPSESYYSLESFIESTAMSAIQQENSFSIEDLKDYLWHIARLQVQNSNRLKKVPEAAGILLLVNNTGDIKVADLQNMMDLKLQHSDYCRKHLYREIVIQGRHKNAQESLVQKQILEQDNQIKKESQREIGGMSL